jgi:hypothetical protein
LAIAIRSQTLIFSFADERQLIGESNVDVAVGVLGELRELGGAGAGHAAFAANDNLVEREGALRAFAGHAADDAGVVDDFFQDAAR